MNAAVLNVLEWNKITATICTETGPKTRVVKLRFLSALSKLWPQSLIKEALERVLRCDNGLFARLRLRETHEKRDHVVSDAYLCYRCEETKRMKHIGLQRMLFFELASRSEYVLRKPMGVVLFTIGPNSIRLSAFADSENRPFYRTLFPRPNRAELSQYTTAMLQYNLKKDTLDSRKLQRLSDRAQNVYAKPKKGECASPLGFLRRLADHI